MGMKVGAPVLKLNRLPHFGSKGGRSGNCRAVILEAMEERVCSDRDLRPEATKDNLYLVNNEFSDEHIFSGLELANHYYKKAENSRRVTKSGVERKLEKDCVIAFAGIIKPNEDAFKSWTQEQQVQFLTDSFNVLKKLFKKHKIRLDVGVIHLDERNPHLHYFGSDDEYKLGRKIGLKLFNTLNREYPKRMCELGYSVDELKAYDEEQAKQMTDDELYEYKAKFKAKREQKHGLTSDAFKVEQDRQANKIKEIELNEQKTAFERQKAIDLQEIDKKRKEQEKEYNEIRYQKTRLRAWERKLTIESGKQEINEEILKNAKLWEEHTKKRAESTERDTRNITNKVHRIPRNGLEL
jgi:hypothetical protein